jgi:hypothetical protein
VGTGREYFERFWVKLIKYSASKRNIKAPRGRLLVNRDAVSGTPLRIQARILNESAKPYAPGAIAPKFSVIKETANGEKQGEFGPFQLVEKSNSGNFDGYYAAQEMLDPKRFPPGDSQYRVVIEIPDSPGETLSEKFMVRMSDPEMDNKRPDIAAMLRMASEFDEPFRQRLSEKVRLELAQNLPTEAKIPRLAFKISDPKLLTLIPECMKVEKRQTQNLGPVDDLWDRGFNMPDSAIEDAATRYYLISWWSGQRLSLVLLIVVVLLGIEWLMRKMLRLA